MKNIRFIAVIALMMMGGMTMKAQDYHPIVEEGKQWNVLFSYPWNPPEPQHKYTDIYKIEGDTLLDGVSYKVMYTTRNEDLTGWSVCGVIRETEDKQVLYRRDGSSYDEILYDFSMEVGDTIIMSGSGFYPDWMFVIETNEILVNGEPRQQIVLEYPFGNGEQEVWIEGIGSLYGIVDSGSLFLTGGSTNLLCYYEDGDLIWQNTTPGYNECYMVYPTPPTPPEPHSFAPQGAEWYFNLSSFMGSPISYYHMEVLGDTIIQGHICSVITQQFLGGNGQEQYVYEDNGKVYWYNQTLGRFTTLYDFDAEVGESWTCEIDSCTYEVTVTEITYYEGLDQNHQFRAQRVSYNGELGYFGGGTIIDGIGEISGLFPYPYACVGDIYDGPYPDWLRCYLVDGEMLYHEGSYNCDQQSFCWDGTVAEAYAGGDGTAENPYQIATSEQLALLAYETNNGIGSDAYYELVANINLQRCEGGTIQWVSIGTATNMFMGHFNGNGYNILNLNQFIGDGDLQPVGGLFGYTDHAVISNVRLVQCSIRGNGQYVGGLVGYAGLSNISNCSITQSSVKTEAGVAGGLVGCADMPFGTGFYPTDIEFSYLNNCLTDVATWIEGSDCAGGIVGKVNKNDGRNPWVIADCRVWDDGHTAGFSVTSDGDAGGIVGWFRNGSISGCLNQFVVTGGNPGTGGIAGTADLVTIKNCINQGEISGGFATGGIVGYGDGNMNVTSLDIIDCVNEGSVTCHDMGQHAFVGGIVGLWGSKIIRCVNKGDVMGIVKSSGFVGGIVGDCVGIVANCYNRGNVTTTVDDSVVNPELLFVGGISATPDPTIYNVYNTGVVTGPELPASVIHDYGNIIGRGLEDSHYLNAYWLDDDDLSACGNVNEPELHGSTAFVQGATSTSWTLNDAQYGTTDLLEALNFGAAVVLDSVPSYPHICTWMEDMEGTNDGFPVFGPFSEGDDMLEAYCEAPFNFFGSPTTDQGIYGAQLWWNKPFASHWFHYDEKPYAGSAEAFEWGIRIPGEEIHAGDMLTHVAFYKVGGQNEATQYDFAFSGGETEPENLEFLAWNSVLVEPGPDEWVMVKLRYPIICEEGRSLWIVMRAPFIAGNKAPYCQTSGNPDARWVSLIGGWYDYLAVEGTGGDWMIRGYFTNDMGYQEAGYNGDLDHYNIYRGSSLEEMEKVAEVGRDEEEYFDTLQQPFGDYYYQLTASYTDGRESVPAKRSENPQSPDYVYFHVGNISSLGSEWYYEIQNENGSITYQHLQYAADTTINHKDVKIIIRTNTLYDKGEHSEVTREYIYEDFGKVYWWNESIQDFTLLYNLGAQVGDEWVIEVGEESIIMHVDAVEQYEYEGTTYRTLHVSDANNLFSGEIMSGIGHLTSFFPERLMTRDKGYRVTGLRCYWIYGDLVFTVNRGDCDAIYAELHIGLDEPTAIPFAIYPNPTNSVLTIQHSAFNISNSSFRITNLMGQTVQTGSLNAETQQIDVSALPQGMYFISVGEMTRKFVVR